MVSLLRKVALLATVVSAVPSPQSLNSDLTVLINNDLQGPSSPLSNSAVILLSRRSSLNDAVSSCQAVGEQLWSPELKTASIQENLNYLVYQGRADASTLFWVAPTDGNTRAIDALGHVSLVSSNLSLPALCTQSAPYSNQSVTDTSERWQVSVRSNNEDLVGYRDRLSFRFAGIRYAPQPRRFTYSVPYNGSGGSVSATQFGSQCVQAPSTGSEDCLFLNIFTPFLPQRPSCAKGILKPVMFWIHGGAFTGGTGSDPTFDGGNLASRGDVVVVTVNYRVTTLGFLTLQDGVTNGNFGLADQINALDWVRAHIQDFGGDPDRITVFGQSAGAASVRAMMASPKAVGKFAAAIPLSNLGGINYGTTYSKYYTIPQEVSVAANAILAATNCTAAASQVDCLRAVPAYTLAGLSTVARYVVVDGTYITSDELQLTRGAPLPFALMMGTMRDDGAPFINYPRNGTTNETAYLASQGFPPSPPPSLFPVPAGPNATLDLYTMASRLATDGIFRCADQATVHAGLASGRLAPRVWYYEFDRSYQTTGWPGTDVCEPPRTPGRPHGDPALPYLRCHSGELYYVFGTLVRQGLQPRDEHDLPFARLVLDSFAAFARAGDPNPDTALLAARGYADTLAHLLGAAGPWVPSTAQGPLTIRLLDWPSSQSGPRDTEQCEALGLGLNYYLSSS